MDMEIVIYFLLDEITHILVDGLATIRSHRGATELNLRLTLEDWLLYVQGYGSNDTITDVAILILAIELLDGLGDMLLEGTLMSTALSGMLTIDKGIILLAILIGMCEGYLNVLALHMHDFIQSLIGHVVSQEILQAMTAQDAATIVHDGKTGVQISIVAKHGFHDVIMERIVLEESIIWFEEDVSTILVLGLRSLVALEVTTLENQVAHLAITEGFHLEMGAEGIDRLHTDTIQADTLLERLAIILTSGIEHADRLDKFALRNTTTIVAHADTKMVLYVDFKTGTSSHLKLVDGIIHHLLQEHVDTILRQVAVAQTTDIHTWTSTHMLHVAQVANVVIGIFHRLLLRSVPLLFFHV